MHLASSRRTRTLRLDSRAVVFGVASRPWCPDSMLQGAAKKYNGPVDVIKSVIKEEGPLGLFRGSAATLARDGSGSVAYFAVYEGIKRALSGNGQTLSPLAVVCGGGFAGTLLFFRGVSCFGHWCEAFTGVCNWIVAIPFDVVKSRIQTAPPGTYKNMMACFR